MNMKSRHALLILWIMMVLYMVVFGLVTSFRHYNFETQTWDMGVFVQTFWNTIEGRIMANNLEEAPNTLGVHMSPWLFLLVPGYALFESPYYLLIMQTIAIALGALPLYLLAEHLLKKKNLALIIAAGYLLYPALHWINTFDFHAVSFFVPLLLASFYFLEKERFWLMTLFLIGAASTREDAVIVVLFFGVFALLRSRKQPTASTEKKISIAIILMAALYFLLSVKILMPALGGGLLRLDRYAELGKTMSEILKNIVFNPMLLIKTVFTIPKTAYFLWLFIPVAFLPFLSWRIFIVLIPGLLENLLTTFPLQFSGLYQYDSVLIPGIFAGTVYGIKKLLEWKPSTEKVVAWGLIGTAILGFAMRSPINPVFFPMELFISNPKREAFRELVRIVPDNVSVAAHTNLIPHLAHREHAYMLGTEPFPTDMILIDTKDPFGFESTQQFETYINTYVNSGAYTIDFRGERYLVLTKNDLP